VQDAAVPLLLFLLEHPGEAGQRRGGAKDRRRQIERADTIRHVFGQQQPHRPDVTAGAAQVGQAIPQVGVILPVPRLAGRRCKARQQTLGGLAGGLPGQGVGAPAIADA
jgi:hypothetical protein